MPTHLVIEARTRVGLDARMIRSASTTITGYSEPQNIRTKSYSGGERTRVTKIEIAKFTGSCKVTHYIVSELLKTGTQDTHSTSLTINK